MKLSNKYDEILSDPELVSQFYELIRDEINEPILECACGSGDLLKLIQDDGYLAFGCDIDVDMLILAKEKGVRNLMIMDMTTIDYNEVFNTVLCVGDSLNYLELKELPNFFKRVYDALNNNGTFIVDMHHCERLNEFKDLFIEEADMGDYQYQWTIQSTQDELHHHFVFYTDDEQTEESIIQHVFKEDEVESHLTDIGFTIEQKEIDADLEKVLYICRKEV